MDVDAYLKGIRYGGPLHPRIETLRALHRAHMLSVPFENLDIHAGREILLDEGRFYEKIVTRKRGGFCYELNGLFAWLLRAMGFSVTTCSAQVFQGATPGPEFDHLALVIHLDQQWLVDVGFGDSFIEPLAVNTPGVQVQSGVAYRIDQDRGIYTVQRAKNGGEHELMYCFPLKNRMLEEFTDMCTYHQTSPLSHFTRKRVCSIATPQGRITISGNTLIIHDSGVRSERDLTDMEYASALEQYFGMVLN